MHPLCGFLLSDFQPLDPPRFLLEFERFEVKGSLSPFLYTLDMEVCHMICKLEDQINGFEAGDG